MGQASANAAIHQTEQQLALASKNGTNAAAIWANLIWSNDANLMLATYTGLVVKTLEDRKACNVPLCLDPPSLAAPDANRPSDREAVQNGHSLQNTRFVKSAGPDL